MARKKSCTSRQKCINLNELIKDNSNRLIKEFKLKSIKIAFDKIEEQILNAINSAECKYVFISCPYFSNYNILKALSNKEGSCIITTYDKNWFCERRLKALREIKSMKNMNKIMFLNRGRGKNKNINHSKYILCFNQQGLPYMLLQGSYNYTATSFRNIENLIVIEDAAIAKHYAKEFKKVYQISKKGLD